MKTFPQLLAASCALGLALAANAGTAMNGDDTSRITNGGSGFIGVTQSVGQPRRVETAMWMPSAQSVERYPTRAGEASTMVNGRPNANPDAPALGAMAARTNELQSMGNRAGMSAASTAMTGAARNPAWGTPD